MIEWPCAGKRNDEYECLGISSWSGAGSRRRRLSACGVGRRQRAVAGRQARDHGDVRSAPCPLRRRTGLYLAVDRGADRRRHLLRQPRRHAAVRLPGRHPPDGAGAAAARTGAPPRPAQQVRRLDHQRVRGVSAVRHHGGRLCEGAPVAPQVLLHRGRSGLHPQVGAGVDLSDDQAPTDGHRAARYHRDERDPPNSRQEGAQDHRIHAPPPDAEMAAHRLLRRRRGAADGGGRLDHVPRLLGAAAADRDAGAGALGCRVRA